MDGLEIQPPEAPEGGEVVEQAEVQALDDATFEPGAYVERTGDFQQAEAIQTSLETMVSGVSAERIPDGTLSGEPVQAEASRATQKSGEEKEPEGAIPISIPGLQKDSAQAEALPVPLPIPRPEAGAGVEVAGAEERDTVRGQQSQPHDAAFEPAPGGGGSGDGGQDITPINLPSPVGAGAPPHGPLGPAPGGGGGSGDGGQDITPINLPNIRDTAQQAGKADVAIPISIPGVQTAADEAAVDGGNIKEPGGVTEIPLPSSAEETGIKLGGNVGAIPKAIPGVQTAPDEIAMDGSSKEPAQVKEPGGSFEVPLPSSAGEMGAKGTADGLPIPIPIPRPEGGAGVGSAGEGQVGTLPVPVPRPEAGAGVGGAGEGQVGSLPTPIPRPAGELGMKIGSGERQTPLTSPAREGMYEGEDALIVDRFVSNAEEGIQAGPEMSRSFNQQYLDFQKQMQDENRRYTMVSNIMKTKHDTAKNAINNVR